MKLSFFFAYCAYIWKIFSHIFRSGCPKVRHNHFIRRERVYLEALHPQDFYLVKLLLLLLDPVTMMAQDEDGTATLAGYQRNGGPSRDVMHFELLAATNTKMNKERETRECVTFFNRFQFFLIFFI